MWRELAPPTAPQERLCHGRDESSLWLCAGGQPGGDRRAGAAGLPGAGPRRHRRLLGPRRTSPTRARAPPRVGLHALPAYSPPDARAPRVRGAARAVGIGGAAVGESYLDQGKLLAAA